VNEEKAAVAWFKQIRNQSKQLAEFLTKVLPKADGPRLPVVLWSRLSFDLAPYLTERMMDGSRLLNFYHRELENVASAAFLIRDKPYHERLAEYFRYKADPQGDRSWTGNNSHALSELPYHLTKAERFEKLYQTLTDFKFLEHKAAEVGVLERKDEKGEPVEPSRFSQDYANRQITRINLGESASSRHLQSKTGVLSSDNEKVIVKTYTGVLQLQEDYERAVAALPGGESGTGNRAPLILTALETSKGLMVHCPACNKDSSIKQEMLDTVIVCPQASCKVPIKLNPFTVNRSVRSA
jgi:hypothetical protein